MANPRATVDFTEINSHYTTFKRKVSGPGLIDFLPGISNAYPATRSTQINQSVSMDAGKTVRVGAALLLPSPFMATSIAPVALSKLAWSEIL